MSRWFRAAKPPPPMVAAEQEAHLLNAEKALLQVLDDNIERAEEILYSDETSFHHVGRALSKFMAAMLSAERETIAEAAALLQVAENKSWEDLKRSQKDEGAFRSTIYPPGTEYLLCHSV